MQINSDIQEQTSLAEVNILLVDDQPANLLALQAVLEDLGPNLVASSSGEEALELLANDDFAVVLLDVQMQGLDGFETAKQLRSLERSRHTPIIFITAYESDFFPVEKAYSLGAVDYLVKPLVPVILRAKVAGFVDIFQKAARLRQLERQAFEQKLVERSRVAEEKLRATEQRFSGFMQHLPGLAWMKDLQGKYVFANDFAMRVFQCDPNRLYGTTDDEIFKPDTAAQFKKNDQEAIQNGSGVQVIEVLKHEDGTLHHSIVNKFPILGPDGKPVFVGGMAIDITERVRAEEQTLFQAHLLDAVEQAAIATDPVGNIIYWNRFAENLYGWSKEEAIGQNVHETVIPSTMTNQFAEMMTRLRAGESWSGEFLVQRRDGTTFDAFVTDSPVFDRNGNLQAIIGISVDITQRKHVERTLHFLSAASATLAAVIDYESTLQKVASLSVPCFADLCTVDITESDGSLRRLAVAHVDFNLSQELERHHRADNNLIRSALQVVRTGETLVFEDLDDLQLNRPALDQDHIPVLLELGLKSYICVPLKVRERILGVLTFVMAGSNRRYHPSDVSFAEELARRAAIAVDNSKLYADLREADRLKDEFLAMLAHELRNPLAPIRNALQIMKMPVADSTTVEQVRDMAERQVQHMARLLDDLLDVSRISRGRIELRKEIVDVASVVNRTVEAVHSLLEDRQHRLTISLPPEPLRVDGDPTRLEQVLTNLLNNAAKYTDPGGQISICVERQDAQVMIRIQDTGIGIASESLPRIFDLFVQAERRLDRSQGGVGIGLTLVRKLVELHGGTVEAFSEGPGRGSTFAVRLPALRAEQKGNKARINDAIAAGPVRSRRVLVVDDSHDSADTLSLLLRLSGHEVQTAYGGVEALEAAQTQRPELIFLDIGMPGLDGYEVARRIRKEPALVDVYLIAMTGWGQEEDRRRTKLAGFNYHLVKPVEPATLNRLLADLHPNPA